MARPRSDIRFRIVHAAREQFLRAGVEGTPLRTIARMARTSIGMVYYYFPNKDDLFFAVVEEVYTALLSDMTQALAPNAPVRERLGRLYSRIGAVSELELSVVRLVVREALTSSARLERLIKRFQRGHIPLVVSALADGVREGNIDPQWHLGVAFLCTLALGGPAQLMGRIAGDRLKLGDLPAGQALSDQLVDILFSGIGTPQPLSPKRRRLPHRTA
jgi:AcrR family transcriptional regulator